MEEKKELELLPKLPPNPIKILINFSNFIVRADQAIKSVDNLIRELDKLISMGEKKEKD